MGKKHTPLVMLHGWTFDANKWTPFLKALRRAGYAPRLLKTPGLTAPLNSVWGLDEYVTWLKEQLANDTQVMLLGHSFGGQVAIRYAARYPEKIAKLILIDSAGVRDWSWPARVKRGGFWVAAKVGGRLFRSGLARKILYVLARERDYYNAPPLLRRTMSRVLYDEVLDDMFRVRAKTLIVWGREDRITPVKMAHVFDRRIPNSTLMLIDGARHSPQFSHPNEVVQAIDSFSNHEV